MIRCPKCGSDISSGSAAGDLCPRCLLVDQSLTADTEAPTMALNPTAEESGSERRDIGPYRLIRKLGEGGMGVVYLAEQLEPIRRRVAIKVVKGGLDSDEVIARFEAERDALTRMEHPWIARVLDAGRTGEGAPYFVMEHVQGVPITEYCERSRLSLRQRLELCIRVCKAVQHAHQKGIIHRDLKPSNVLVELHDDEPVPKIIDFGIARALEQSLMDKSRLTSYGMIMGTPAYMSPEQATNILDVDTRTDVYALGVVLFEVLTGSLPFEPSRLLGSGIAEMVRILCEELPERPSERVAETGYASWSESSLARSSGTPERFLQGDLDWIVLKALEKERDRRYSSAADLADDIEKHLCDEPVAAGPPSAVYRIGKFVRRNRGRVVAAAAILVTLVIGLSVSFVLYRVAEQSRERAEGEAARAESALETAQTTLLQSRANALATASRERLREGFESSGLRLAAAGLALSMRDEASPSSDNVQATRDAMLLVAERAVIRHGGSFTLFVSPRQDRFATVSFKAYSSSGSSAGLSHCASLWTDRAQLVARLTGHSARISAVAFSPDGSLAASASWDGTARLFTSNGELLRVVARHDAEIEWIAFSPDSDLLITASFDDTARVWSLEGRELARLQEAGDVIRAGFLGASGRLVTVTHDHAMAWSSEGERLGPLGPGGSSGSPVFSYGGEILFPGSDTLLVNVTEGKVESRVFGEWSRLVAISGDGSRLAGSRTDASASIWDTSGVPITSVSYPGEVITALALSWTGDELATGHSDGSVALWSDRGDLTRVFRGHQDVVRSIHFLSGDDRLLTASTDGTARLWDLAPQVVSELAGVGDLLETHGVDSEEGFESVTQQSRQPAEVQGPLSGLPERLVRWTLSPDGRFFLSFESQEVMNAVTTRGWTQTRVGLSSDQGRFLRFFPDGESGVVSASFSPSGERVLLVEENGAIRLFDLEGNSLLDVPPSETPRAAFAMLSPDERLLLSHPTDGGVARLLELTEEGRWEGDVVALSPPPAAEGGWPEMAAVGGAFSPDGRQFFTVHSTSLHLWSRDGQPLEQIAAKKGIREGAFSGDNKLLLAVGAQEATVWELDGPTRIATLAGHPDGLWSAAFAADGRRVLTVGNDGLARIHSLDPTEVLAAARTRLASLAEPSKGELQRYGGLLDDPSEWLDSRQRDLPCPPPTGPSEEDSRTSPKEVQVESVQPVSAALPELPRKLPEGVKETISDHELTSELRDELCGDLRNSSACARVIEAKQLTITDRAVRRSDGALELRLSNGDVVALYNYQGTRDTQGTWFHYRGHLVDFGYFLVGVSYYEWGDYLMIHDGNGARFRLEGLPILSPDRRRILTYVYEDAMGEEAGIEVWRLEPMEMVLEVSVGTPFRPTEIRWLGGDTIDVVGHHYIPGTLGEWAPDETSLTLIDGKWTFPGDAGSLTPIREAEMLPLARSPH